MREGASCSDWVEDRSQRSVDNPEPINSDSSMDFERYEREEGGATEPARERASYDKSMERKIGGMRANPDELSGSARMGSSDDLLSLEAATVVWGPAR